MNGQQHIICPWESEFWEDVHVDCGRRLGPFVQGIQVFKSKVALAGHSLLNSSSYDDGQGSKE